MNRRREWWEVETDGEFLRVRGTLGNSAEIRQLIKALEANLTLFDAREKVAVDA